MKAVSDSPSLDAQVLLSDLLNRPRAWILAHPEVSLSQSQQQRLDKSIEKLLNGVPLPYILGRWEFYNLEFIVTPDVLIPRPETELLVEYAIDWLEGHPSRRSCADIGTGSGCIGISIAHRVSNAHFIANDITFEALAVARENAQRHNVLGQIRFFQGTLLQAVGGKFDLIAANLPYIPEGRLSTLEVYGREPSRSLNGGPGGLRWISQLLSMAPYKLGKGGVLLLEIDETQGAQVKRLGKESFPEASITIKQDLSGQDRLLIIRRDKE